MSQLTSFLNPGPSAQEQMYGQQAGAAGLAASNNRGILGNIADNELAQSNQLLPQSNQSFQDYMNYLGRNTTDQQRAGYIANATNGLDQAYQSGQAGLANDLRSRGLSPDSSVGIGGLSLLAGQRANAFGGAIDDAYNHFDQMRQQNLGTIAGQTYGRQQNALGQAQGQYNTNQNADMSAASMYANLQNQAAQRRQQQQQQRLQMLGQFAQGIGSLSGMNTPVNRATSDVNIGDSSMNNGQYLPMSIDNYGGASNQASTLRSFGDLANPAVGRYNRFQTDFGFTPNFTGDDNYGTH